MSDDTFVGAVHAEPAWEPISIGLPQRHRRRNFIAWSRRYVLTLAVADAIIGAAGILVPSRFSNTLNGELALVAALSVLGAIAWTTSISLARGYVRNRVGLGTEELRAVLRAGVGLVVAGAFPAGLLGHETLLKLVVVGVPFAVVVSTLIRYLARKGLHRRQRAGTDVRQVVVVGTSKAVRELTARLNREKHCGMKVVGVCLPSHEIGDVCGVGVPVLGDLTSVATIVRQIGCDAIAVTSDDATRDNYLRKLAWSLEGAGVEMFVDPGLVEVAGPRMHIRPLMGAPLLHIEEPHFSGWRKVIKRSSDLMITSLGLIAISPILVAIAILIKLQDGGPVLFRQKRVGQNGDEFWMYKFRSMVTDAETRKAALMAKNEGKGGLFKLTDDPRITPLGRFLRDYSFDELPQLFNVLNGSMSLVGPRPHLAHEIAQMPSEATRRTLVTPGLTGLWQVSGRSDLEGDEGVRLDLRYVENWTFTLDILILWKTASAVLAKRGAR
ncbi:sugar transferase [Microlunatus aurantiacus]